MRSFNIAAIVLAALATFVAAAPTPTTGSAPALLKRANAKQKAASKSKSLSKSKSVSKSKSKSKSLSKSKSKSKSFSKSRSLSKSKSISRSKSAAKAKASKAAKTTKLASSSSSEYSGKATWYTQDGTTGACGTKHSDSSYVVALNLAQYGSENSKSSWCGKTVTVTNSANGKSVNALIADACPGCASKSLDLSVATFKAIGSMDTGVLSINWGTN